MESFYQEHKDKGLIVMQALFQNNDSATPTAEDLAGWADTYSATFPILSDDSGVGNRFEQDGGIPTLTVIGPGAEVIAVDTFEAESIALDLLGAE